MKFAFVGTKSIIKVEKHGHRVSQEFEVATNSLYPYFGIIELCFASADFRWAIVHLISERVITSIFRTKLEAEEYFEYLSEQIDLNSLLLCHPDFNQIKDMIQIDVELAYKKYLSGRKEFYEENNYI